jgi:hypothetical protein
MERSEAKVGPCRSYQPGIVCADGFVQKPYCSGRAGCHACGHIKDSALPYCLREELPEHLAHDDGSPLFFMPPNAEVTGLPREGD